MTKLTSVSGLLLLASTAVYADVADTSADQYDYIATPVAEQTADLTDNDNDGVINARDLCEDTPTEAAINNDGCGTNNPDVANKPLTILFANNSSEINLVFKPQISGMAQFLQEYPNTEIELSGYASQPGNDENNMLLSQQRAEAVQAELVNEGVDLSRIKIVAYGETNLLEAGDDQVSNAKNRRVTASVIGFEGKMVKQWTIYTSLPRLTTVTE